MKNLGNLVFFNVFSIFSMKRLGNLVLFNVLLFYSMNWSGKSSRVVGGGGGGGRLQKLEDLPDQ